MNMKQVLGFVASSAVGGLIAYGAVQAWKTAQDDGGDFDGHI